MRDLLKELKRRKVFRVAAVYAVVAWLVVQIADVILPTFNAPQGFNQAVILILALGFPIALVLAWAFEISPDNSIEKTDSTAGTKTSNSATTTHSIVIPLMMLAVSFLFFDRYILSHPEPVPGSPLTAAESATRSSLVLGYFPAESIRTKLDIAPDGRRIAFIVRSDQGRSLYLHDLASGKSDLLFPDRGNMTNPVFSRDGTRILVNMADQSMAALSIDSSRVLFEESRIIAGAGRGKDWLTENSAIYSSSDGSLKILM